jgi:hypothetical protein
MTRRTRNGLIVGAVLIVAGLTGKSWLPALIGIGLLIAFGYPLLSRLRSTGADQPWPWPPHFRTLAEGMARPIDPTPKRVVPPHENAAIVAKVATTKEELKRLIADKTAAWPWALFASVLVQRRNAVTGRLRAVASGYQPRPGMPLSGLAYTHTAYQAMNAIADQVAQLEQFMLSPAFKGAFGDDVARAADPDAVAGVAHRLMDYHESFLAQAETCLQTPVESEVLTYVQDMGAFAMCPLLGFEEFIPTMCARIAEAQELLPYTEADTVVALDDVKLKMEMPDGLMGRLVAQAKRFND